MTGIDKICDQIRGDAEAESAKILERADHEAREIRESYAQVAKNEAEQLLARGKAAAEEREKRLGGVAQLEARKLHLKTKQQMLDAAFDAALAELRSLPADEYVSVLAHLAAESAVSGNEEIILSADDRDTYGKQVVAEANRLLKARTAAQEPEADTLRALGKKVLAAFTSGLTLADETRNITGGLILKEDKMEINATFKTLIRLIRDELSGEVAGVLFR